MKGGWKRKARTRSPAFCACAASLPAVASRRLRVPRDRQAEKANLARPATCTPGAPGGGGGVATLLITEWINKRLSWNKSVSLSPQLRFNSGFITKGD